MPPFLPSQTTSPSGTPDRQRRQWWAQALALGMAATVGVARAQSSGGPALLPASRSLPEELKQALARQQALVVMASLEGCPYCRIARQSHLVPMWREGLAIVQVDLRSPAQTQDFEGKGVTHDELTRRWRISITPTLLFFGPGGKEVAERMEGAYLPDFYGPYLEQRLQLAKTRLR